MQHLTEIRKPYNYEGNFYGGNNKLKYWKTLGQLHYHNILLEA